MDLICRSTLKYKDSYHPRPFSIYHIKVADASRTSIKGREDLRNAYTLISNSQFANLFISCQMVLNFTFIYYSAYLLLWSMVNLLIMLIQGLSLEISQRYREISIDMGDHMGLGLLSGEFDITK